MMNRKSDPARPGASAPGFTEFVAIIALMMGLTAFSIDNLLPAFEPIHRHFAVQNANDLQLIISAYLIGFAVMQIVFGTLSDVFGRKTMLMIGLAVYAGGCVLAMTAESFNTLLFARAIQGMGSAAARVLSVAIVRDRFQGRDMARVMSFAMMVFLVVPIVAPAAGGAILLVGNWHMIFGAMLLMSLVLATWFALRMPETLHPEYRVPFSMRAIFAGLKMTVTNRRSFGYANAMGLMLGCLMAYVGSSQQIFETEVYHLGRLFPLAFAAIAGVMSVASFINARLVNRVGMRRLSHFGLCGFTLVGALQVTAALGFDGRPPVLLFCLLVGLNQALFALTVPNFNSIAMEPLGAVAGTASSFLGFYTTLMGALLGMAFGRAFDGTVLPLGLGYCLLGALGVLAVLWAERWRLFGTAPGH
ncbi:multidrug effflux MFS transporter [Roseixanthobacter pseudopolyaromaticivorans]|uniref:multidrug effflux MFS transporter n=1 Tax=Xanthobacteraceae TaxID=335928 RepID=UPI0037269943